jgi:hypothetical protein
MRIMASARRVFGLDLSRARVGALSILVSLAALGATGCAGSDATKKQLADLELQVSRLKADVAVLSDRLDLGSRNRQAREDSAPKPAPEAVPAAADDDRPPLEVVTLAPDPPPKAPVAAAQPPKKPEPNPVLRNTALGGVEAKDGQKATLYDSGKKPLGGYKK